MPLRRVLNTFCYHSNEDALMSNTTTSSVDTPFFSAPLAPSCSVNGSTPLRKRRRQEGQSSERASKRITAMRSSTTTSTPVVSPTQTSIPDTPLSRRPNLSLNPINNSSTNMPESSPSTSHCPKPASPAPTEIAYDISHNIEQSPEERIDSLSSRDQSPRLCVRADA
jgi:hypothetical protein